MRFFHRPDNCHCLNADGGHAHQQVDGFFFVVCEAVGVELLADGRGFEFLFFVLVENPFERRAVAESVIPGFGRDAG
jgi:hypothetical protein